MMNYNTEEYNEFLKLYKEFENMQVCNFNKEHYNRFRELYYKYKDI